MPEKRSPESLKAKRKARAMVSVWYQDRVDRRVARYRMVDDRPTRIDVLSEDYARGPDPLADAKAARPENWRTSKTRDTGTMDPNGQPVTERIPILEALTADGVPTRNRMPGRSRLSQGIDLVEQGNYVRDYYLALAERIMLHVLLVDPEFHRALEMEAGGYPTTEIARELDYSEHTVRQILEAALAVVRSCLVHQFEHWLGNARLMSPTKESGHASSSHPWVRIPPDRQMVAGDIF